MIDYLDESLGYLEKIKTEFKIEPFKVDNALWYFSYKNKIFMVRFSEHKKRKRFVVYDTQFGSKTREIFESNNFSELEIFLKKI